MDGLARLQANNLARNGRYGDTELLHVSKSEIAGLDNLARSMGYDGLTTNPVTGAKEAFLFTPFIAPLAAGGLGGLAGTAIGTGLIAGGLGAAEAKLRGMDDPLKQGLMAGLTAGGLSAIGSAASGAAEGAQAAQGVESAGQVAEIPALAETSGAGVAAPAPMPQQLMPTPADAVSQLAPGMGTTTAGIAPLSGSAPADYLSPTLTSDLGAAATSGMPLGVAGQTFSAAPAAPGFMDRVGANLTSMPGRFMNTVNTLSENPKAFETFTSDPRTKMGGVAALMGYTGSAGLEEQAKMDEEAEDEEKKQQGEYNEARNRILSNYASVGRSAPWMYQEGGDVNYPRYMRGEGDGMSDGIPALIEGEQPAALSDGEFVIPADVVSALGNGSSEAGARKLYELMKKVRQQAYGREEQMEEVDDLDDLMEDGED